MLNKANIVDCFTLVGWDIKDIRIRYEPDTLILHLAINCYGICGDADGDADAGRTSLPLLQRGGLDLPDFANSESCLIGLPAKVFIFLFNACFFVFRQASTLQAAK